MTKILPTLSLLLSYVGVRENAMFILVQLTLSKMWVGEKVKAMPWRKVIIARMRLYHSYMQGKNKDAENHVQTLCETF